MNISKDALISIIREEVAAILQDDAIFSDRDLPGILSSLDIPGDLDDHEHEKDVGRNLGYGHSKSTDREGRSTKKQLYYIYTKSQSLYDIIRDDDDLPEWVQSKVSRAADKISSVYEYLEYKLKTDH